MASREMYAERVGEAPDMTGRHWMCKLSSWASHFDFAVMKEDDVDKTKQDGEQLAKLAPNLPSLMDLSRLEVDALCAVQDGDEPCWLRAKIKKIEGDLAELLCLDTGEIIQCETDSLKALPVAHAYPPVAVPCRISDSERNPQTLEDLQNKRLNVRFVHAVGEQYVVHIGIEPQIEVPAQNVPSAKKYNNSSKQNKNLGNREARWEGECRIVNSRDDHGYAFESDDRRRSSQNEGKQIIIHPNNPERCCTFNGGSLKGLQHFNRIFKVEDYCRILATREPMRDEEGEVYTIEEWFAKNIMWPKPGSNRTEFVSHGAVQAINGNKFVELYSRILKIEIRADAATFSNDQDLPLSNLVSIHQSVLCRAQQSSEMNPETGLPFYNAISVELLPVVESNEGVLYLVRENHSVILWDNPLNSETLEFRYCLAPNSMIQANGISMNDWYGRKVNFKACVDQPGMEGDDEGGQTVYYKAILVEIFPATEERTDTYRFRGVWYPKSEEGMPVRRNRPDSPNSDIPQLTDEALEEMERIERRKLGPSISERRSTPERNQVVQSEHWRELSVLDQAYGGTVESQPSSVNISQQSAQIAEPMVNQNAQSLINGSSQHNSHPISNQQALSTVELVQPSESELTTGDQIFQQIPRDNLPVGQVPSESPRDQVVEESPGDNWSSDNQVNMSGESHQEQVALAKAMRESMEAEQERKTRLEREEAEFLQALADSEREEQMRQQKEVEKTLKESTRDQIPSQISQDDIEVASVLNQHPFQTSSPAQQAVMPNTSVGSGMVNRNQENERRIVASQPPTRTRVIDLSTRSSVDNIGDEERYLKIAIEESKRLYDQQQKQEEKELEETMKLSQEVNREENEIEQAIKSSQKPNIGAESASDLIQAHFAMASEPQNRPVPVIPRPQYEQLPIFRNTNERPYDGPGGGFPPNSQLPEPAMTNGGLCSERVNALPFKERTIQNGAHPISLQEQELVRPYRIPEISQEQLDALKKRIRELKMNGKVDELNGHLQVFNQYFPHKIAFLRNLADSINID